MGLLLFLLGAAVVAAIVWRLIPDTAADRAVLRSIRTRGGPR